MLSTVADVLVGTLEQIGVRQIFGLIGDSLNLLADAVRRSGIEWIGVRHTKKERRWQRPAKPSRLGQLAVCAGTTGPGSNHLVAGLYEACRDHAPALVVAEEMPNLLHVDFEKLGHFALAKVKEAVLAVRAADALEQLCRAHIIDDRQ
jgi:pyruvate dehydrogenase (quinone)